MDAFTADRVITESEEQQLRQLSQQHGLTDADLSSLAPKLHRARCLSWALQGRALPVSGALNLKRDEICFFSTPAILLEERTTRRYVSGSRGVSIRIAKGLTYRVGSSRGHYVPVSQVVAIGAGTLSITSDRFIFTSPRKTVTVKIADLLSFDSYDDGLQLHHEDSKGLQVFQFADGEYAAAVLSGLLNPVPATGDALTADALAVAAGQPTPHSGVTPWYKRSPLSYVVTLVTVAGLVFFAPVGVVLAWSLRLWSVPVRALASIAGLAFFIYAITTGSDSKEKKAPASDTTTAHAGVPTPTADAAVASRADEAAWVVEHCKPDKDVTQTEGGQAIRHLTYRKRDVELMYARDPGETGWQLIGRFKASKDEALSELEVARRLPCAKGHLKTVTETDGGK